VRVRAIVSNLQVILNTESFLIDIEGYRRGESTQLDWQNADWKEIDGKPVKDKHQSELEILLDLCSSP